MESISTPEESDQLEAEGPIPAEVEAEAKVEELKVTFIPPLYLQRRIWILDQMRKTSVQRVLDVGCGEGSLLYPLVQAAPWLSPPPPHILPPSSPLTQLTFNSNPLSPISPLNSYNSDEIANLHISEVHGLDISEPDLQFAVDIIKPPNYDPSSWSTFERWEQLVAKVWKGGLQVVNEEFVGVECIVSSEVIEHLSEDVYEAFNPMLLGVYHPQYLLVTTPSYTFNARFLPPDAPMSSRNGFPDPTSRTDRVFRHDDHKFEWTWDEFVAWCQQTAQEWGYDVEYSGIGRAHEVDPWGRDDELGGASCGARFIKLDGMSDEERERKGRERLRELGFKDEAHRLLASYQHAPSPAAMRPESIEEIAKQVVATMEELRESFITIHEAWFRREISLKCGGWIELLVRAVEESPQLTLVREVEGKRRSRDMWTIELVGGVAEPMVHWPMERGSSLDYIPQDWTPGEPSSSYDSMDDSDRDGTGVDGDVSAVTSDDDADVESEGEEESAWARSKAWQESDNNKDEKKPGNLNAWATWGDVPSAGMSSTAGWDGDESDDTTG